MDIAPGYEESHLVVAAVRILHHKDGRSPTPEDVAGLLGFSTEKTYVLVHELRKRGILRALESAFELRLDIGDPAPLETLPKGATGPSIEGELAEFHSKEREKRQEMEKMFLGGEAERRRRERVEKLEKEFMNFKPKPGGLDGLFKPGAGPAPDAAGEDDGPDAGPEERGTPPPRNPKKRPKK